MCAKQNSIYVSVWRFCYYLFRHLDQGISHFLTGKVALTRGWLCWIFRSE